MLENQDLMFYNHRSRWRKPPPEALFPKNSKNLKNNIRRVNESSPFFIANCLNHDSLDSRICLIFHSQLMSHVPANVALNQCLSRVPSNVALRHFACAYSNEQSRAEQSRAEQSRAEQSRAEQSRAEQSRAEQSRAEQSQ